MAWTARAIRLTAMATNAEKERTEIAMHTRLTLLIERLRRRRAERRRYEPWPLSEPVVPTLRGWPVERAQR
jgi:hypothetical protein